MTKQSKAPKPTAFIATDTNGNITTDSTMSLNGQTIAFEITEAIQALGQVALIRRTFDELGTRFEIPATSKLVEVRNAKNWLQGYTFEVAAADPFRVTGLDMDFLLSASEFINAA